MTTESNKPTDVLSVLLKAKEILSKGWARLTMSRDAGFETVEPDGLSACYFCLTGALARQFPGVDPYNPDVPVLREATRFLVSHVPKDFDYAKAFKSNTDTWKLICYNDSVGPMVECSAEPPEHVRMLLDAAIASLGPVGPNEPKDTEESKTT